MRRRTVAELNHADCARLVRLAKRICETSDLLRKLRAEQERLNARVKRRSTRATRKPAPRNCTAQARQVWAAAYPGQPWPKGWRVELVPALGGYLGRCWYGRRLIELSINGERRFGGIIATLIHEFVHVRNRKLRHGPEFYRLTVRACERVGVDGHADATRLARHDEGVAMRRRRAARPDAGPPEQTRLLSL